MARIQLDNQLRDPLQRVIHTGVAYTIEPPETIQPNSLVFWQADDTGTVTYGVAPEGENVSVGTGQTSQPRKQLTLEWRFSETGQPSYLTRDVDQDFKVAIEERIDGATFTVTNRHARRIPVRPRSPARRATTAIGIAAFLLLLTTVTVLAFGPHLSFGPPRTTRGEATATFTATPSPTITPTPTPIPTGKVIRRAVATGTMINGGETGNSQISCQPGEQMLGGGYYINNDEGANYQLTANYPSVQDSSGQPVWTVIVENQSLGFGSVTPPSVFVFANATCLQSSTNTSVGETLATSQDIAVDTSQVGEADAICPAGGVVTGGGYVLTGAPADPTVSPIMQSSAPGQGKWVASVYNPPPPPPPGMPRAATRMAPSSGAELTITSYALCATQHLNAPEPALSSVYNLTAYDSSTSSKGVGGGDLQCPAALPLVTGGGYAFTSLVGGFGASFFEDEPLDLSEVQADHWRTQGTNYTTSSQSVTMYIVCAALV
ncbi:MAG: hypothetical protein OJF49_001654 [Ktedonobacterales bacterium]|nr:MAG: hypothetical protein OJF49_001654 [Ktedonobacterales bacterium]